MQSDIHSYQVYIQIYSNIYLYQLKKGFVIPWFWWFFSVWDLWERGVTKYWQALSKKHYRLNTDIFWRTFPWTSQHSSFERFLRRQQFTSWRGQCSLMSINRVLDVAIADVLMLEDPLEHKFGQNALYHKIAKLSLQLPLAE